MVTYIYLYLIQLYIYLAKSNIGHIEAGITNRIYLLLKF